MKSVDLEKYKEMWKNDRSFEERKLSSNEIFKFLKSSSKGIIEFFRRGLIFDLIFKTILLIAMIVLFFLIPNQLFFNFINLFIILIILTGIGWQFYVFKRTPFYKTENHNVIKQLHKYILFYNKFYISSIYIAGLSSTLVFLIGSIFYLHIKYQEIPQFQIDDFLVMSIGILLSYGLSTIPQLKFNNHRINQLKECLNDIEDEIITDANIKKHNIDRKKWAIAFGITLIVGLILLLIFYTKLPK